MSKIKKAIDMVKANINKFSFAQMTSNSNGKTSASGTMGVLCVSMGVLCFTYGVIDFSWMSGKNEIMSESLLLITLGTGLLGYRKSKDGGNTPIEKEEAPEDQPLNEQGDLKI